MKMVSFRAMPGKAIVVPALFALACWAALALISLTQAWQLFELKLLDQMVVRSAPNKSMFPITVIGIDEASMAELKLQWPWPRRLHAQLIDRLAAAGAAVIVFDVVFSEPSNNSEDDKLLAAAIQRAGNVVLAAGRQYRESSQVRQWVPLAPLQQFTEAGAQTGQAMMPFDADQVVRQIPDSSGPLWRAAVVRLIGQHPEIRANLNIASGAFIRYAGADHTFPYVPYHEVVRPTGTVPADFFRDQIVIVGFDARASPDAQSAQGDMFATPFLASAGWLTPGVEVHANIIETALGDSAIVRLPEPAVLTLLALASIVSAFAMRRWRPLWSLLAGLLIGCLFAAAVWGVFLRFSLWVPALSTFAVIGLMYIGMGGYSFLLEQAHRQEITRAFSLYVTPQVVAHMIAHPESVKLGGERRNLTVMFTDLAGFTTFSEALSPERVTYLLNRHFTDMTDIVLEHSGTVARFIGDAIMAFWGAPVADDDQTYRAVISAMAMQKAMESMRDDFVKEGLPPIQMRIGIHRGSAVVGNLGSAKRFDYTAIGDDVNLAARLEGINKLYGTGIMLSGDVARSVEGRIALRLVDRVIVKGKSQAVDVYTPCEDAIVVDLGREIIRLVRNRDWDAAEAKSRDLLEHAPEDKIAQLYLDRIAALRINPPASDWDGSAEMDKL